MCSAFKAHQLSASPFLFQFLQDRFDKRLRPFVSIASGVASVRRQISLSAVAPSTTTANPSDNNIASSF